MSTNLKSMSRKELEKLIEDAKKALQSVKARDKRDARKAAERAASEFGFSLDDLADEKTAKPKSAKAPKKKQKTVSPPKYVNPADPAQTWTGKGRQPNWYRAAIEAGMTPQSMAVK